MATILNAVSGTGLTQTSDGSGVLVLQGAGVTGLTVDSTGAYGQLKSGTPQNTTSGTAIDFTGIPSWVKRITVMLNGVSTNGSSPVRVQIGSGSVQSSGYAGFNLAYSSTGVSGQNISAAFELWTASGEGVAATRSGMLQLCLQNATNTWVAHGKIGISNAAYGGDVAGSVTLSGTLDRIRLTTVNGTDTFDAGSVNILYEG